MSYVDRQWGYAAPGLAKTGRCTTDTRLTPTLTSERPVSKTPALREKKEPQPGPPHPRVLSPFSLTSLVIASDSSCEWVSSKTDTGIRMKSSSEKLYIKDTIKSNTDKSWWQQLNFEGLFCFWHRTHGTSDLTKPRVTQGGRDHVGAVLEIRNRHPPSSRSRGGRLSACEPYPPPHTALASGPTAPVHPGHPSVWPPAPWHQHTAHCVRIPPFGITMWSRNLIEEQLQPGKKNTH